MSRATFVEQSATPSTPAAGRETIYPKTDGIWYRLDDAGVERPLGYGFIKAGTTTLDFGAAPGSNRATAVITSETAIAAGSVIQAFMMSEASADHNAYEHDVIPIKLTCGTIVPGVGFTITGVNIDLTLTGVWNVRWTWF